MPDSTTQDRAMGEKSSWLTYSLYIFSALLIIATTYARARLFPIVSVDYTVSLVHWMDTLRGNPGLSGFRYEFSNYAPLYLYFLKILTFIPISYLYSIKALTVVFDIALGIVAALIVKIGKRHFTLPMLFAVFALIFSIPTVILNGAAWAQVDSAYTLCILISLYFILKDNPLAATIAFALAFCFKLQALFFLPVLIGYLFSKGKEIWYLVLIPVIFVLIVVPAGLSGGSFTYWTTIYWHQSQEAPLLTRSAPSVFSFIDPNNLSSDNHPYAAKIGLGLAFAASALIAFAVMWFDRIRIQRKKSLVALSLICVIVVPFFLPYMHDRYFFMADVLSLIFAVYEPYLFFIPIAVIGASLYSYLPFLSATIPSVGKYITNEAYLGGAMLFALVVLVGWFLIRWYTYHSTSTDRILLRE